MAPTSKATANSRKEDRVEVRISADDKLTLERAAALAGLSVSAYVLRNSIRAAREELASHDRLILSDSARDTFLRLLDQPPRPNARLKAAARDYRKRVRETRS